MQTQVDIPPKTPPPRLDKQTRLIDYLKQGYAPNKAMDLAGYSQSTIKHAQSQILRNIDTDALFGALKVKAVWACHQAYAVVQDAINPDNDIKTRTYGAKLAFDAAKVFLAQDKAPTQINFHFQTIKDQSTKNVQININKNSEIDE